MLKRWLSLPRRGGGVDRDGVPAPMTDRPVALSLVVPTYNEALRLPGTLERMRPLLDAAGELYEVIVVDDGSTDGTVEAARRLTADWPELDVVRLPVNAGKGAAVREGMLGARGAHRAFSDADLSTPLEELSGLRAHLRGDCQVAIASRGLPDADIQVRQPKRRELMGRTYNVLLRLLVLPDIRDFQCGLKVFTATAAEACFRPLRTMRFGFDAELLVRARRQGREIAEIPVRWRRVEASRVSARSDAARMLYDLLRLRFARPEADEVVTVPKPTIASEP
jgi:dolichyl-phosphate beta-glucosyltransferase